MNTLKSNFVAVLVLSDTVGLSTDKSSSVTETKLDAILFCSDVNREQLFIEVEANSVGYSETEEPMRFRKKHYLSAT